MNKKYLLLLEMIGEHENDFVELSKYFYQTKSKINGAYICIYHKPPFTEEDKKIIQIIQSNFNKLIDLAYKDILYVSSKYKMFGTTLPEIKHNFHLNVIYLYNKEEGPYFAFGFITMIDKMVEAHVSFDENLNIGFSQIRGGGK